MSDFTTQSSWSRSGLRREKPIRRVARLCMLVAVSASLALVLASTSLAANETAAQFAVRLKQAELAGKWAVVWKTIHPRQRAYIPQALFVACKSKIRFAQPTAIRAVSVSTTRAPVPGLRGTTAPVSVVKVRIDYGRTAPSQTAILRATRIRKQWYSIDAAKSRRDFQKSNFCS
jgi:hypothetical protein